MNIKLVDGTILSNGTDRDFKPGDQMYLRHESELIEVKAPGNEYDDGTGVLYKVNSEGRFEGLKHLITDL